MEFPFFAVLFIFHCAALLSYQKQKKHLEYAGADHDIFSDNAVDEIFKYSSSSARLINKACTHCLLYGAQNGRRIIDDHMVKLVIQGELS